MASEKKKRKLKNSYCSYWALKKQNFEIEKSIILYIFSTKNAE